MKSFSTVINKIRELAKISPERTAACQYFDGDGAPRCIVGHVLANAGVKPLPLEGNGYDVDGYQAGDMLTADGAAFARAGQFAYELPWDKAGFEQPTAAQLTWVSAVQGEQDNGETWATAVSAADTNIGVAA